MHKILITLSVAAALFAGQVLANQATFDSLQAYGIQLSAGQTTNITNAEGQQLVDAITQLIAAQPAMAATIVAASTQVNPSLSDATVAAAIQVAPAQEQAILDVVAANQGLSAGPGSSIPMSSIPSMSGSSGGSSGGGSVASPN